MTLHVVEAGPPEATPVLLLHGFPEFWWGWRRQIAPLVAAGFRVVVPDLRGFNLSDKPRGIRSYRMELLVRDVLDLIDELRVERARIAAHDWGGAVAWWLAQEHPARVERLAVLNVPHPAVLRRTLLTSREQRRRSRYLFYFLLPLLPERKIRAGGFRPFRSILKRSSRPGTFSADDLDRYAEAAARPGALTAMLNWYRAGLWFPPRAQRRRVEPPVCLLWGTADTALGPEMIEPSVALCRQCEVFRYPDAGHWLQHEATAEVNERLLDFLV